MRVELDEAELLWLEELAAARRGLEALGRNELVERSEARQRIDRMQDALVQALVDKVFPYPSREQEEFVFGA